MSIDGMHWKIEHTRRYPTEKWYSQRKKTPGLTYEIGCAINHDKCLCFRCPFRAGEMNFWMTLSPIIDILSI